MSDVAIGQTVQVLADGRLATVRYVGQPHFAAGDWVGIELGDESGKNDGSVQGERYFECEMGRGMFVRPTAITIVAQPAPVRRLPVGGPAAKPGARPSSLVTARPGRRTSTVPDTGTTKRMSMNAASPSPSPAMRSRQSGMLRSPTKSPTKQLASAGGSSSSTPRTTTPSTARPPSITMGKPRQSVGGARTSMGPPALPASRAARPSLAGPSRPAATTSRPTSLTRPGLAAAAKPKVRPGSARIGSVGSRMSTGQASEGSGQDTGDDRGASPIRSDDISPAKATSPVSSRAAAGERSHASPRMSASVGGAAANREIEDLKTKLRLMEKKRLEDRDKLKALEKVEEERDRFEKIIHTLQAKYQPQQQEITDLRKQLKEAAASFEEIENIQAEHDITLEMATLDREMAEETAEVLRTELEALKLKTEELELEVEVLREENTELSGEMSPEEKSSQGWLQMERNNERLREALMRLRDMTQQTEAELRDEIKILEDDVVDFSAIKEQYEIAKEKLAQSEALVEDLRQQLDNALGAEDMIEELTEKIMSMSEQIDELKATIEDLESLKELNDELEINHIETEKDMQEDIDFKDNVIADQARRAAQQDQSIEDMEYTLSRFRELVTNLQNDLEDIKASHAVTETESEQLNSRSRQMMDLNMKLQVSAAKTQIKAIDLELRRLDAQEASEHLTIVQLFLPDSYDADRDSVLALLRFKRVAFKANMLHGFIKERASQSHAGHEDDGFAACDVLDKLVWVAAMCDRFVNAISCCSIEEFSKYEGALYELEPVERALNSWIDGLRRDDLKEKKCATELQRTIALLSHLAEVHIAKSLASYADDVHMRTVIMQSHLDNAAAAISSIRTMVQTAITAEVESEDEDDLSHLFARKIETVITATRSAKVVIGKAVRALEDLKSRSLSLAPSTVQIFEQCETATEELARFSRHVGDDLFSLLHEEGRTEAYTYQEVQATVHSTTTTVFTSNESDLFSTYSNKLRTLTGTLTEMAALASDLSITEEFERPAAPWVARSQQLKASKTVPVDAEEELRRLKEENHERARMIALRDQTLEESSVKIELLESRMRDASKKNELITELEKKILEAKTKEAQLAESIESQNRELIALEADKERWKKTADENKVIGVVVAGSSAGQERAVATAREMDALKSEISSLQAAVRFLREDNRRTKLSVPESLDWLDKPLRRKMPIEQQRKELILCEGEDVLDELIDLVATSEIHDFSAIPTNRLAWRPAHTTPRYHVARQREDYAAWSSWSDAVVRKGQVLRERGNNQKVERGPRRNKLAAKVDFRLPGIEVKGTQRGREVEIVKPDDFENLRDSMGFV